MAPELEFFLTKVNEDPDYPLVPPIGRSRRQETARQSFGIDAVNEFDPIFEDVYDWCEAQEIDVDTLTHEAGAAQMEINFNHGNALELADQAFLFKRTLRQAALKHGIYATFMAKPMAGEPGSSMHIHQSVIDRNAGRNLFSKPDGEPSPEFYWFIGGLQKFLGAAMPLMAPNINSYRRLRRWSTAPINVHWGDREPDRGPARADLGAGGAPGREPDRGCGRQPLSRHGGDPGLRLARHHRRDRAQRPDQGHRLPPRPDPAAADARGPAQAAAELRRSRRCWARTSSRCCSP